MKRRVKVTDERRVNQIRWQLLAAQRQAAIYLHQVMTGVNSDSQLPDSEKPLRFTAAKILAQGAMAEHRAKQQAQAPKVFGVVMMQSRIEDPQAWERMHAQVAEGKAIDVEATPVAELPPKDGDG